MAPPPKLRTLRPEDYDFNGEATEWGPKLLFALTQFCSDVVNALTKQLTREDNMRGETREVTFSTGAAVAIDATPFPLLIQPRVTPRPKHVTITNPCVDDVAPIGAAQPFWHLGADGGVVIRLISGLDTNTTYKMRFLLE